MTQQRPAQPQPALPPDEHQAEQDDAIIGLAFKWSIVVIALAAVLVVAVIFLNRDDVEPPVVINRDPVKPPDAVNVDPARLPQVRFTDITSGAGIDFVHENGARGEKLLPETMGGGCAFFDLENDGDQDILLINSRAWSDEPASAPARARLYTNDGRGNFEDATDRIGLDVECYGMGCAIGDVDGNGYRDVFIAALGRNRLLLNDGTRLTDVTDGAGIVGDDGGWSTSAGFFDFDRDGDLDLFVCQYVQWSREIDYEVAYSINGVDRAYGPPTGYRGADSKLFRNDGTGRFTDVSAQAGIEVANAVTGEPAGKALAVTFVDVDQDGWLDIFVANDTVQNFLFRNRQDGTFEEVAAGSGVGFDSMGAATGAMGVDAASPREDGRVAIAIANFSSEMTSLYVQQPSDRWQFADMSSAEGIGSPSRLKLSFGLFFFDYDLDGRQDLLQANGHLDDTINEVQPSQHYRQPAQLFWNCGQARGCFMIVPDEITGDLAEPIVARGSAYADIDGDGDLDVLFTQIGERPMLLRNEQALGHHWLRVRLQGKGGNTEAIGAVVECTVDGRTQRRTVMPTRSYLSQVELPITFGLGAADTIDSLRIIWPDGSTQDVEVDAIDREIVLAQP